jgi:hypothetical protein
VINNSPTDSINDFGSASGAPLPDFTREQRRNVTIRRAILWQSGTATDVIHMANDTEFGLAARDLGRAWRLDEQLEYGMVGINSTLISAAEAAFGGVKRSRPGREGGRHGIDACLETKYVNLGGPG